MLNSVYQLVRPRQFEVTFKQIEPDREHILVRPTHLSICNADQRYYQGTRPEEILRKKLPMALIHEAVGQVIYDPTGQYRQGDRVVMVPNTPVASDPIIAENYLRSSLFRGSSLDGFMQEYVLAEPDRILKLPDCLDNMYIASFTEMVAVCYHAVSRFEREAHKKRDRIGVWGNGNMGYFTALMLKTRFPESEIIVFGRTESKLNNFSFADEICLVSAIPEDLMVDHAFECVGGAGSGNVINQIIDHINPEGTIGLLGVSEEPVPINTRMVLEKGLRLMGASRCGSEDFAGLLELYEKKPEIISYLETMVGGVVPVHSVKDINSAFEMDIHKMMGKTIMEWDSL